MKNAESKNLADTLGNRGVHQQWEDAYRTPENEEFYEEAFDYIVGVLNAPKDSTVLDVGCGVGAHSIRLARRGFFVVGADFSETVLMWAEENVRKSGMEERIRLKHEDILAFTFGDERFDYVLCWGILMHVHDIEKAISELARIMRPGGRLVISEGNMHSLQSIILRTLKNLFGEERATVKKTPAGLEYWTITSAGKLLTREADISWLVKTFEQNGFTVKTQVAGQFTELYTRMPFVRLRKPIHLFNNIWFRHVRLPRYSFGTMIILQKGS